MKTKLSKIQRELSMKNSYSNEKLIYEAESIKEQRRKDHKRSSSHRKSVSKIMHFGGSECKERGQRVRDAE